MAGDGGDPGLVCVGVVSGARGIKGDVRIKSFTGDPEAIASYGDLFDEKGETRYSIRIVGRAKDQLVVRVDGIGDRTAAEALKGTKLYVPRHALPEAEEDEFYLWDLIGLAAEHVDGTALGRIEAVQNFGAGDFLEVVGEIKGGLLVPFTAEAVPVVDVRGGKVVIDPPPGLMEPPDEEAKGS